ncbi:hypothetical protein VO56_00975 [Mycoplasmopsis gallinacea]|uniref:YqaJ viral recombinase domain-containing protein n=1 Tax=Mycoplasmopsis gallinacea TaxID=29556 RepID=A0A0D5ZJ74_9BACT|nr:hypothetical protein VO56_00975 [Mycoplasmopsis gallinacea]
MATRKFYNKQDYDIDFENNVVILKPQFHEKLLSNDKWSKFKKIGGSTVGDVLIKGAFKSEFSAFCHISRIKLPVLTKKYVNAGVILEPKIFDFLRSRYPKLEIVNYEAEKVDYDFFKDVDTVIGGVPDGYLPKQKCILEIKTAGEKKLELWEKEGVDISYRKQAQLYSYLSNSSSYKIIALFLKEDDYLDPASVDIVKRKIRAYDFTINQNEVLDDITKIKDWFKHYTTTGVSPVFNPSTDADQLEYLKCENETQWEALLNKWKEQGKADPDTKP